MMKLIKIFFVIDSLLLPYFQKFSDGLERKVGLHCFRIGQLLLHLAAIHMVLLAVSTIGTKVLILSLCFMYQLPGLLQESYTHLQEAESSNDAFTGFVRWFLLRAMYLVQFFVGLACFIGVSFRGVSKNAQLKFYSEHVLPGFMYGLAGYTACMFLYIYFCSCTKRDGKSDLRKWLDQFSKKETYA